MTTQAIFRDDQPTGPVGILPGQRLTFRIGVVPPTDPRGKLLPYPDREIWAAAQFVIEDPSHNFRATTAPAAIRYQAEDTVVRADWDVPKNVPRGARLRVHAQFCDASGGRPHHLLQTKAVLETPPAETTAPAVAPMPDPAPFRVGSTTPSPSTPPAVTPPMPDPAPFPTSG